MQKVNAYQIVLKYARELRTNQTEAENIIWKMVRNRNYQGYKFTRQHILKYALSDAKRNQFFIVDFYCSEKKLVIEIDGDYHKYQLDYDKEREEIINALGLNIIRFSNEEVFNNLNGVKMKLTQFIKNLQ